MKRNMIPGCRSQQDGVAISSSPMRGKAMQGLAGPSVVLASKKQSQTRNTEAVGSAMKRL